MADDIDPQQIARDVIADRERNEADAVAVAAAITAAEQADAKAAIPWQRHDEVFPPTPDGESFDGDEAGLRQAAAAHARLTGTGDPTAIRHYSNLPKGELNLHEAARDLDLTKREAFAQNLIAAGMDPNSAVALAIQDQINAPGLPVEAPTGGPDDPIDLKTAAQRLADHRAEVTDLLARATQSVAPEEQAAAAGAPEAESPAQPAAEPSPEQPPADPLQAERERIQNEAAALQHFQALSEAEQQITHELRATDALVSNVFPGVRTMQDVEQLARHDPQRAAALIEVAKQYGAKQARLAELAQVRASNEQQISQAYAAEQAKQFQTYAQQQDDAFVRQFPDGNDPKVQAAALEALKASGVPEQRIAELWHNNPEFRSAEMQAILYRAGKQLMAERAARDIGSHRKVPPPPMKPGVSSDRPSADVSRIERLASRLGTGSQTQQLRAAAELQSALRESARR